MLLLYSLPLHIYPYNNHLSFIFTVWLIFLLFWPLSCKKRLNANADQIKDISKCTHEFVDKLLEEAKRVESFASEADEMQIKSIAKFKKAYEVIT